MGDCDMSRFFRTSPQAYTPIQIAIDNAFSKDYIDTGRCEHILPVDLKPMADGLCYLALPEWMTSAEGADRFTKHPAVEEIDEETYLKAQPKE